MKKVWIVFLGLMLFSLVAAGEITFIGNTEEEVLTLDDELDAIKYDIKKVGRSLPSSEEICGLMKGCWDDVECYPYGYRINNSYCGLGIAKTDYTNRDYEKRFFLNQSNAMKQCSNSFECKSNFCFNGECIDTISTVDDGIVKIDKSDLEELKSIIENAEESIEKGYDEEVSKSFFSSLIGLFKNIFGL